MEESEISGNISPAHKTLRSSFLMGHVQCIRYGAEDYSIQDLWLCKAV